MSEEPKVFDFRYSRANKMLDEAIPHLEHYLSNADSEELVASSREALAKLIIGSCYMKPSLKESLGVSDETLQSIGAGEPIPRSLVERLLAHLKSARDRAASCLDG